MIRAAAKNHARVGVVTSPDQYDAVLDELRAGDGELSPELRRRLAEAAFRSTAGYDAAIAGLPGRDRTTTSPRASCSTSTSSAS